MSASLTVKVDLLFYRVDGPAFLFLNVLGIRKDVHDFTRHINMEIFGLVDVPLNLLLAIAAAVLVYK